MKKILNLLLAVFPLMSLLISCSDSPDPDVIWDIAPAKVYINIVDQDGNNLLDRETTGNWIGEKMTISYDDNVYEAIWNREDLNTSRYCLATFYGLMWTGVYGDYYPKKCLSWGEFAGEKDYDMKLKFTVDGVDTVYELEYHHSCKWKKGEPYIKEYLTYQGKKIEGNTLTIVLPLNSKD